MDFQHEEISLITTAARDAATALTLVPSDPRTSASLFVQALVGTLCSGYGIPQALTPEEAAELMRTFSRVVADKTDQMYRHL